MAKATKLRQEEKAKNPETITDSQEAQTAVAQALTVLKEFYAKAAEATALLRQQPEAPEIFDKEYKGMQSESGGVVGMPEVIESDFARLEADTKAAEASAQKEHDEFMTDSQVDQVADKGRWGSLAALRLYLTTALAEIASDDELNAMKPKLLACARQLRKL